MVAREDERGRQVRARLLSRTPALLLASLALIGAGLFAQAAGAVSRQSCANLKGKRLARSRTIKVVEQRSSDIGVVYACVPPNGRVRRAGIASDALHEWNYSVAVLAVAGSWVALEFTSMVDPISDEHVSKVFDAARGKSYRFSEGGQLLEPMEEDPYAEGDERVLLNSFGQLALVVDGGVPSARKIVGIESSGRRRVLDSGPPAQIPSASLTLTGHTVQWVDAGSIRTAIL